MAQAEEDLAAQEFAKTLATQSWALYGVGVFLIALRMCVYLLDFMFFFL
jgi:hypothetical protein